MKQYVNYVVPIFLGILLLACHRTDSQKIYTEEEFKLYTTVESNIYSRDSSIILELLNKYLQNHKQSFYSDVYSASTNLILDTILYGPDLKQLVVFVLARNSLKEQIKLDEKYKSYYDGFCYLGSRKNNGIELEWFKRFKISNYYNEQEAKEDLKAYYFTKLASVQDANGNPVYKFNVDDKRFWKGPVWSEYLKATD